ncbi:hypothetical protein [Winogradskyella costae]|uniref:hypothetical protein n=1 Tax=Winogradskyella costae TaxID=2697008 RepID=UPI0015CA372E|nr:hypothetical protein [Winogradskyella costae]
MKLLRRASYVSALAIVLSLTYQCTNSKNETSPFESPTVFKVEPIVLQESYAGINVAGNGKNGVADKTRDINEVTGTHYENGPIFYK